MNRLAQALALLAALALVTAACKEDAITDSAGAPSAPAGAQGIEFETIEMGGFSAIGGGEPELFKLVTEAEWEEFWARHKANITPAPPAPPLDFARTMVIAAVDREEPSGGYRFAVTAIEESEGGLVVRVRRDVPGPDCIVTTVISQPFHIVRLAKSDLEAELAVSEETYGCG